MLNIKSLDATMKNGDLTDVGPQMGDTMEKIIWVHYKTWGLNIIICENDMLIHHIGGTLFSNIPIFFGIMVIQW